MISNCLRRHSECQRLRCETGFHNDVMLTNGLNTALFTLAAMRCRVDDTFQVREH